MKITNPTHGFIGKLDIGESKSSTSRKFRLTHIWKKDGKYRKEYKICQKTVGSRQLCHRPVSHMKAPTAVMGGLTESGAEGQPHPTVCFKQLRPNYNGWVHATHRGDTPDT